jgi:excisionase family DNA binding protein
MSELLTRKDVSKLLHVSLMTVIRWESDGKLKPVRLSAGSVRYRAEDVQQLISDSMVSA